MDLINKSAILTFNDLIRILDAVNKTLPEFCNSWNIPLIKLELRNKASRLPHLIISDSKNPPVFGFHDIANRIPYARVYIKNNNISEISRNISHEIFELITNPYKKTVKDIFMEVCDPVSSNIFDVDGVSISDWVYPSWFDDNGIAPFNKLNTLKNPFENAEGGYTLKMNLTSRS
jgi:hypothetical protein